MEKKIIEKVEREVECPICLEVLQKPKLLECLHIFCLECLGHVYDQQVRNHEPQTREKQLKCSVCKSLSKVPEGGVKDFKSAFYINSLLEIVESHGKDKHDCPDHKDRNLDLYCETCQKLVCINCVIRKGRHHDHEHQVLEEAFKRFKAEVGTSQTRLCRQMNDTDKAIKKLHMYRNGIYEKRKALAAGLERDIRKSSHMSQVHRISFGKLKNLETEEEKLKSIHSQLKGCYDYLKNSLETGNHYHVLDMKAQVMAKIKTLNAPIQSDLFYAALSDIPADGYSMNTLLCEVPTPDKQLYQPSLAHFFAYPASKSQSYYTALLQLPTAFYYNASTGIILTGRFVEQRKFPRSPTSPSPNTQMLRRIKHDSFKPPHGPTVHYLKSVGYGKEVDLPDGIQEVYNPCTQTSLFLDHNNFKIVTENIRPQPSKPVLVKTNFYSIGDGIQKGMSANLCFQASIIEEAFNRAKSKPVGCTLSFQGQNGSPGANGTPGAHGANGGRRGIRGGDGGDGQNGGKGEPGKHANRGGDANFILSGSADELIITGCVDMKIPLGGIQSEQILLVDCHGGDGGRGGCGGGGGDGGTGGDGGNGAKGRDGRRAGEDGGHGEDGGDGGNGGFGGQGGDAGDGGNAGDGGRCIIQCRDPKLLMLLEIDLMPGNPGAGAKGGQKGIGGKPGIGGGGGVGGNKGPTRHYSNTTFSDKTENYYYTAPGLRGREGRKGQFGRNGVPGLDSRCGQKGQCGGMLWVVYGSGGELLAEAGSRYNAKVEKLTVTPVFSDGILEPHERISVSGVVIRNTGGIGLPGGAQVSIPSTDTIKFESHKFDIPENAAPPDREYVVPFKFHGRIDDLAPPNKPGPQSFKAEFSPRIELLGRPFDSSYKGQLLVRYPIQLGDLCCPTIMDQGEVAVFSVQVKNLSGLSYGNCKDSGGRVVLHLHFDSRLIPLDVVSEESKQQYVIFYDHTHNDSTFIEILNVPSKQTLTVNIRVLLECNAEVFDQCHWQVDLHLRDKLVEYNQKMVTVIPTYDPHKDSADVLLITNNAMTRQEFVIWSHILDSFGLSYDIWDIGRYNGLSIDGRTGLRHQNTWYSHYNGKIILYPHCRNVQLLAAEDIAQHFHGEMFSNRPLKELDSSLIVFMTLSVKDEVALLRHLVPVHPSIEIPENSFKGKHMKKPDPLETPRPYANCEKKIMKKIEEKELSHALVLKGRDINITSLGFFNYSYGKLDVRLVPILKSSKFVVVSDSEKLCNPSTEPTKGPPTSRYSQTILAILYGVSIPIKLKLMKKQPVGNNKLNETMFYLPDGSTATIEEIVMIVLVKEVVDELYTLSGEACRMKMLRDDIRDNTKAYIENGSIILRGLKLIDKEYDKRRSAGLKHIFVNQVYKMITEMCKEIKKLLKGKGVKKSKVKMFSFDQLQSSQQFRFCHQHVVDENMWNLADN